MWWFFILFLTVLLKKVGVFFYRRTVSNIRKENFTYKFETTWLNKTTESKNPVFFFSQLKLNEQMMALEYSWRSNEQHTGMLVIVYCKFTKRSCFLSFIAIVKSNVSTKITSEIFWFWFWFFMLVFVFPGDFLISASIAHSLYQPQRSITCHRSQINTKTNQPQVWSVS